MVCEGGGGKEVVGVCYFGRLWSVLVIGYVGFFMRKAWSNGGEEDEEKEKHTRNPNRLEPSCFDYVKSIGLEDGVVPRPFVGNGVKRVSEIPSGSRGVHKRLGRKLLEAAGRACRLC